ncbi:hypothetical protein EDD11_002367 [Mortierella claussenii]|nr:hypothetical protein EDD11_002367 [Mortierella claussenii]
MINSPDITSGRPCNTSSTTTTTSLGNGNNSHENSTPSNSQNGHSPRGQQPPESAHKDEDERPELDDFVKGFYDGDKFTDVDSRVWV